MNCAFTSLGGLLFNCPSWIFYMLYYNSRALLRYNNSSKIPCTKPWFFPSKFCKISLFMKVLKIGIFGRFLTEYKIHYLAIFLPDSIVTGMPYLPAKDEVVSLNRRSSRGLWKWYNSKVLDRRLYGVGQHFTFCRFSQKRKFLETLILIFAKWFTKGFFLTEYEEFRNFRFDGKFSIFTDSRSVKMHIEFRVSDNNRPFAIDGYMINFL